MRISILFLAGCLVNFVAYGQAPSNKGVGPVTEIKLDEKIDSVQVEAGKKLFSNKCSACHKFEERLSAPALKGVTQRRAPEWIMNMILNPAEMTAKDPVAQDLLGEFMVQMPNQNVKQEDARAILEYFREIDSGKSSKADEKKPIVDNKTKEIEKSDKSDKKTELPKGKEAKKDK